MNWRKPVIYGLLYLSGSKIPRYSREIKRIEKLPRKEIKKYQEEKLKKLLLHAWKNVPYYAKVLEKAGVVKKGVVNLKNFNKIPILTKEIIRKEEKNLPSKDYKKRKPYENTSGGSTGEPVKFIQDKEYWERNVTDKIYFNKLLGKDLGEKEINLWGSERDILKGSLSLKEKLVNFLYNRTFFNAFKISDKILSDFTFAINEKKPVAMWVYVESIDSLAKYISKNKLYVYPPKFIITTAGTLFPEIRKKVEGVFKCPVYNQYGSREVGPIAIECQYKKGLHYFPWTHYLELIGGNIYVTLLTNYSMPLIRYKVGDIGVASKDSHCKCGRNTLFFKEITGRVINHFRTKEGNFIHGQYFIHLLYFKNWIKKFQIIQKDYDLIVIKILKNKKENKKDLYDAESKIRFVMGQNCKIKWEFVKDIKPTKSGKYLYTISEVR